MTGMLWWMRQIALIGVGCFFLFFGIRLLKAAYQINDPFAFILTFFAANFIILISGALIVRFVVEIRLVLKMKKGNP